ncbi:S66 peptidase family protein [Peribacillus sp. SCS-37]|uniref:S66 family peptidase n=1 Tax=Paraperibacillus esterisolvens TaxID=3115296 RepID=UPI003905FFEF
MIIYPELKSGDTIAVTAPSSGVPEELHGLLHQACRRLEKKGYGIELGATAWKQEKAKSAPAAVRASELNHLLSAPSVGLILPPWGGELLIEILEYVDFEKITPKWVLGYSDVSLLLLAITLKTGIATAHGTNLVDLRGEFSDSTTAMWEQVLTTKRGSAVSQTSSLLYQKEWNHEHPSPCVFYLSEPAVWKAAGCAEARMQGRLLGGCLDIIRHIAGTPFADIDRFREKHIGHEPILWYFENCEMNCTELRRTLLQLKLTGWFKGISGIMFGRSKANQPVEGYEAADVYLELTQELGVPVVYDIDCGHMPPQMTFINGAWAEVEVSDGKGRVVQKFV